MSLFCTASIWWEAVVTTPTDRRPRPWPYSYRASFWMYLMSNLWATPDLLHNQNTYKMAVHTAVIGGGAMWTTHVFICQLFCRRIIMRHLLDSIWLIYLFSVKRRETRCRVVHQAGQQHAPGENWSEFEIRKGVRKCGSVWVVGCLGAHVTRISLRLNHWYHRNRCVSLLLVVAAICYLIEVLWRSHVVTLKRVKFLLRTRAKYVGHIGFQISQ